MTFPHPSDALRRASGFVLFTRCLPRISNGLAVMSATLGSYNWLGFITYGLAPYKKRLALLGAQRRVVAPARQALNSTMGAVAGCHSRLDRPGGGAASSLTQEGSWVVRKPRSQRGQRLQPGDEQSDSPGHVPSQNPPHHKGVPEGADQWMSIGHAATFPILAPTSGCMGNGGVDIPGNRSPSAPSSLGYALPTRWAGVARPSLGHCVLVVSPRSAILRAEQVLRSHGISSVRTDEDSHHCRLNG